MYSNFQHINKICCIPTNKNFYKLIKYTFTSNIIQHFEAEINQKKRKLLQINNYSYNFDYIVHEITSSCTGKKIIKNIINKQIKKIKYDEKQVVNTVIDCQLKY